jgi:hypothetical protein
VGGEGLLREVVVELTGMLNSIGVMSAVFHTLLRLQATKSRRRRR